MIIDHRTYTLFPRKVKAYLTVFEEIGLPVQRKHLGEPLGYYLTEIGEQNQLVHLWAYKDYADMEERRQNRNADPEWKRFLRESVDLIMHQETKIIRPVEWKNSNLSR